MSKRKHLNATPPDTSLPVIQTGNAWLPTPPEGGTTSTISALNPALAAPDPTAPLNITPDMFQDGITETAPNGTPQGIATNLCATGSAAVALQNWLAGNGVQTTIVWGGPTPSDLKNNLDKFSAYVPWLEDGKGARENVGMLLTEMQLWSQLDRRIMLSQTVGAFEQDDALAKTEPASEALQGGVPNEDTDSPIPPKENQQ